MSDQIEELILLIREEENVLENFLDCLSRQKEYIVQNKTDEFDETVKEEEELIIRIRTLESGRIHLVQSIANSTGAAQNELTLTRLIEMNLGENSEELKKLKRALAGLVDQVKRASRVNQYLIRRSLSFIQKNIDWFIDDGTLNATYMPNGTRKVSEVGNLIVDRTL